MSGHISSWSQQELWALRKIKPSLWNQVWAIFSGMVYKKNQRDIKIKPRLTPIHERIIAKREDNNFKVGLPKQFVLHGVSGNLQYHLQAVVGCLPEPPQTVSLCFRMGLHPFWPHGLTTCLLSCFISSPSFPSLALKELLHLMLRTDDTASFLSWEHYLTPLGKPSCHAIKVSSKSPFIEPIIPSQQLAFHRHDQTAHFHQAGLHIRQTEIQMHEQRGCLWLSTPSLTQPGLGTDWIPGSCTGGR